MKTSTSRNIIFEFKEFEPFDKVAIWETQNELWSESRLRPQVPNFDGTRFTIPRQRLLEMVHAALAGEFVEE